MKGKVLNIILLGLAFSLVASAQEKGPVGGGNITFNPKNMSSVVFSHEYHAGKGLHCNGCHFLISKMSNGSTKIDKSKITKDDFCVKCHNGQKAFDLNDKKNCVRCHK